MAIPPSRRAYGAGRFHLEIDGIASASFVRCSGLAAATEILEYAEGGAGVASKLRGDSTFSNIRLERGAADRELFAWYASGDRRDGAVVLLSPEGREVLRWSFSRGWPCRWEGPELDARDSEVAIELLEVAHEGLQCSAR